ncbi:glutamate ABC transporter substrate-binding protein [Fodinicola acaciae]|uniref:glutamate ABC transporter substrate-binding protein n=1 Tax=Fodinicola acaciae TaxID=2681555 RepID=UPI0013D8B715|nr:glutamate ABC transporter substrate-binding protein [Fodinicola acaciae]
MMRRVVLAVAVSVLLLTGCGAQPIANQPVRAVEPLPPGAKELTNPAKPAPENCGDPTASLRPGALPSPGQMPAGSTMQKIALRGSLIVGVDQNTYKVGYRDPFSGQIEGFDIDIARAVAKAIFGDPNRIQLRVLTSAQRVPALQDGTVDIVVRTMTITCARLKQVAFSTVYYQANQRILAKKASGIGSAANLNGKKVCATSSSTSLGTIVAVAPKAKPVAATDWTDCLVMLQQDQVDAVSTDDTILAGMAAQDRYTQVVGPSLAPEPYGIAVPLGKADMVRFVNGVLERIRADGTWQAAYDRWLAGLLGPVSGPPQPRYRG